MLTTFLTIAVLHWVALVTPGVNFVLILQLAAGSPRSVSLSAAAGITTVTFLWALLAILGMGAAFSAHPALRQAFQIAAAPTCATSRGNCGSRQRRSPPR